jgi:AraC-like DNA-binding protein
VVIVREEQLVPGQGQMRQAYELAVGVMYRMFRAQLGPRWRALSVSFVHGPPPDMAVHRRIFGPIVEFGGDFNGLTCSQADLDAPNPSADPAMAAFAERFVRTLPNADRQTLSNDVQKAIHLLLPVGGASIGQVAGVLGVTERTLQRKLAAEGADFSGLLDQVRRDLVQRYLGAAQLPMSRIAGLVGYGTQSSFNRWFADAFGASPSTWRKTAGEPPPASN